MDLYGELYDDLVIWGVAIVKTEVIDGRVTQTRIDPVSLEGEEAITNPDAHPEIIIEKLSDHNGKKTIG